MKAASLVLCALLAAAPAVAVCPCPESAPTPAPMGCEGTAGCCCGDAAPAPSEDCPRAERSADPAEVAPTTAELGTVDVPLPCPTLDVELPASPAARPEGVARASPPARPPHLTLTALLL